MALTKTDLVRTIAKDTGVSQGQAGKMLDAVLSSISDALAKGEDVRLTGFGTFKVSESKERQGRNLRTGEAMTIPARRRASFTAGSQLTEAVRGGGGKSS